MIPRFLPAALLLVACSGTRGVTVSHGFAYAPVSGGTMAAYFTLVNRGRMSDTLTAVSSPRASSAAVHEQTTMDGMVHMQPAGPLPIAAGDSVVLAPGGRHLMLELSGGAPAVGDSLPLTLRFARSGEVHVRLPVRAYGDAP